MKGKEYNTTTEIREVGKLLCVLNNSLRRKMESTAEMKEIQDISGKNGWIIGFLFRNQDHPVYQKDLEKEFGITRSTASKVVILMEKNGYIERQGVEGDARLKQLVMTDKARSIATCMMQNILSVEETLKKGFSEEELNQLISYMNRILNNLNQ